jgi:hypothetical protein
MAQVPGLVAMQRGRAVIPRIGNPAAARHALNFIARKSLRRKPSQKHFGGRLPASPESVALFRLTYFFFAAFFAAFLAGFLAAFFVAMVSILPCAATQMLQLRNV